MTVKHCISITIEDEEFWYVQRCDKWLLTREEGDELFSQLTDVAYNYESKLDDEFVPWEED